MLTSDDAAPRRVLRTAVYRRVAAADRGPLCVGRRPICFPCDASFGEDLDWFVRVCRIVNGIRGTLWADRRGPTPFGPAASMRSSCSAWGRPRSCWTFPRRLPGRARSTTPTPTWRQSRRPRSNMPTFPAFRQSLLRSAKLEYSCGDGGRRTPSTRWPSSAGPRSRGTLGFAVARRWADLATRACPARARPTSWARCRCTPACWPAAVRPPWPTGIICTMKTRNWPTSGTAACFPPPSPRAGEDRPSRNHGLGRCGERSRRWELELVANPCPLTLCRVTQAPAGQWKAMVAQGHFEYERAETFGGYGWCRIANLQRLYRNVLLRHFPHHVAITRVAVGNALWEALGNYLGMDVYHARQESPGSYRAAFAFLRGCFKTVGWDERRTTTGSELPQPQRSPTSFAWSLSCVVRPHPAGWGPWRRLRGRAARRQSLYCETR